MPVRMLRECPCSTDAGNNAGSNDGTATGGYDSGQFTHRFGIGRMGSGA